MRKTTAIIWFRNNLRVTDNHILSSASHKFDHLLPIYIFDTSDWEKDEYGHIKTNVYRTKFILESVRELRENLRELGSDLIIKTGDPAKILPNLVKEYEADQIITPKGITPEDVKLDKEITQNAGALYRPRYSSMLYHPEFLPFKPLSRIPNIFTSFRKKVELKCYVAKPVLKPEQLKGANFTDVGELPALKDFGFEKPAKEKRAAFDWQGGEEEGLDRLHHYVLGSRNVVSFYSKRNEMMGSDFSTKLSPYLSLGCISPQHVWHKVEELETRKKDRNSYWVKLVLIWREYFRHLTLKYRDDMFAAKGIAGKQVEWKRDEKLERAWKEGRTGIPIVDASMREIAATGYMSNKGRQITASFLTQDLKIDWRVGASWFRSLLIDYDVYSNYGNWAKTAGVGVNSSKNQYVNPLEETTAYAKSAEYIRKWIPELKKAEPQQLTQWPFLSESERKKAAPNYTAPVYVSEQWKK